MIIDPELKNQVKNASSIQTTLEALAEPVERSLDYLSIGRKLLYVQSMSDNEGRFYPDLDRDFYVDIEQDTESLFPRMNRGRLIDLFASIKCVPKTINRAVPIHAKLPELICSDTKSIPVRYMLDRMAIQAMKYLQQKETKYVIQALLSVAKVSPYPCIKHEFRLSESNIRQAFGSVEGPIAKMICHTKCFYEMVAWEHFDMATTREMLTSNLYGHYLTADVHATDEIPTNVIMLLPSVDEVGVLLSTSKSENHRACPVDEARLKGQRFERCS